MLRPGLESAAATLTEKSRPIANADGRSLFDAVVTDAGATVTLRWPEACDHGAALAPRDIKAAADFWNDLASDVDVVPDVVARYRRLLGASTTVGGIESSSDGTVAVAFEGPLASAVIRSALSLFSGQPPVLNNLELSGYSDEHGPFLLTLQKRGRFSPGQARDQAEDEAKRLHALCLANGVDPGELALVPRAVARTIDTGSARPGLGQSDEWLWVDIRQQPNVFCCDRCGGRATAPTPCSMEDYGVFEESFRSKHKRCEVGDAQLLGREESSRGRV